MLGSYWGSINPFNGDTGFFLLYPPLFKWDKNFEPIGCLVKEWKHSADFRTWTYTLHDNIKWHDGVPFTTQDVQFTWDIRRDPENPQELERYRTLNVIDDFTFAITFHERKEYDPTPNWNYYLPKHIYEGKTSGEIYEDLQTLSQPPVGYGPYRYVRHLDKTMVELKANPDYFLGELKIDRVVIKYGGEELTELLAGNVDIAVAPREVVLKLADDPRFNYYYKAVNPRGLFWNQNHFLFKDLRVRLALTLAIDRREIYRLYNIPDEIPIVDGTYTHRQILSGELPEPLPYDPEQAKKLFEEAGWKDMDGDGILDKGDRKFRFTVLLQTEALKAATLIQAHFKRQGIQMDIQTLARGPFWLRVEEGEFDAYMGSFKGGIEYVEAVLGRNPELNIDIGYASTEMENILDEYYEDWSLDSDEGVGYRLGEVFQRDIPVTFIYRFIHGRIVHRRIKGLSSPSRIFPLCHMERLWIEED
jgi:peptide/nickel transport system substrate-binding protein